jgi:hypothetical protein
MNVRRLPPLLLPVANKPPLQQKTEERKEKGSSWFTFFRFMPFSFNKMNLKNDDKYNHFIKMPIKTSLFLTRCPPVIFQGVF